MTLTIKVSSQDADATDDPRGLARRTLERCLQLLDEQSAESFGESLRDINGNRIGSMGFNAELEDE